jgi:hypothetical protein
MELNNEKEATVMRRKTKARNIIISAIAIVLCAIMGAGYLEFGTINAVRVAYGISAVREGKKQYVIVKNNILTSPNKVVITQFDGDYTYEDCLEEMGYTVQEQFGSSFIVEKNGKKETAYIEGTGNPWCDMFQFR